MSLKDDLEKLLPAATAYEPCMSLTVEPDGKSVELMLDGSLSTYGERIKGEGADICFRAASKSDSLGIVRK